MSIFSRERRRVSEEPRGSGAFPTERGADTKDDGAAGALDTLASVLRTLGRVSFDLDDEPADSVKDTLERAAQHVLVGAPLQADGARAAVRRDWSGVGRVVLSHRRREVAYVVKALDDLRGAVRAFTTAFARVTADDGKPTPACARSSLAWRPPRRRPTPPP